MRYPLSQEVFERLRSMASPPPKDRSVKPGRSVPRWTTPRHWIIEEWRWCKNSRDCLIRHGVVRKIKLPSKNLYCSEQCLIADQGMKGLTEMVNTEFAAIGKEPECRRNE